MPTTFYCSQCKEIKPRHFDGGTGHATKRNNHKICYSCMAILDRQYMIDHGHGKGLPLYITHKNGKLFISNWPETLKFKVSYHYIGNHNIAGHRQDVWFRGPDSKEWHGTNYGHSTAIIHCKRTKEDCQPQHGIQGV